MKIIFYLCFLLGAEIIPLEFDAKEQIPISKSEIKIRLQKMRSIPVECDVVKDVTLGFLIQELNLALKKNHQKYTITLHLPGYNLNDILGENINEKNLGYSKEVLVRKLAKTNCLEILNIIENSTQLGISFWEKNIVAGDIAGGY